MRLTKQTIETLRAIATGDHDVVEGLDRATLAAKLGIPYSSACGRVRRLIRDELVACPPGEWLVVITDDGLDVLTRSASS